MSFGIFLGGSTVPLMFSISSAIGVGHVKHMAFVPFCSNVWSLVFIPVVPHKAVAEVSE
jgi:hypothetical protein